MNALLQILITTFLVFLLAGSLLGLALGCALLARSARATALVGVANRWVSTRRVLRPVELPRDTGHGNRGLGVVLIVAGAYALLVLAPLPVERIASALRIASTSIVALIGLESAKWLLVVGCAVSVASGAMLLFFPRAWHAVEERTNRWYSSRRITAGGDEMHVPLDSLAERHPVAAGAVILALSLASAMATGLLLTRL